MKGRTKWILGAAALAVIILLAIRSCGPSARKQFETVEAKVPDAIQFMEENKEFLDMLLDIQRRIKAFNEEGALSSYSFLNLNEYTFSLREDGIQIRVFCDDVQQNRGVLKQRSKYDLLASEEKEIIEAMLMEFLSDRPSILVSSHVISISYMSYNRAFLHIENPVREFVARYEDSHENYWVSIKINDDWCIYYGKMQNN